MLCPVISSYLDDTSVNGRKSKRESFNDTVRLMQAYKQQGEIPNVEYSNAKFVLNNRLDDVYEIIRHKHVAGKYQELPVEIQKYCDMFCIIYLHQVRGLLVRSLKFKIGQHSKHPFYVDMVAFLSDAASLADVMGFLKDKTVKRQPKPVEEQKIGYHPPKVSTDAERQVVALLEAATERAHSALKIQMMHYFHNGHKIFLEALAKDQKLTPYKFFCDKKIGNDYLLAEIVEKIRLEDYVPYVSQSTDLVAVYFGNKAEQIADEYRTHFVHKNFRKIASVIDGKKMKFTGEELSSTVSLTGMEGSFVFRFEDGSSFVAINRVVYAYSKLGNPFNQFPLRFTAVMLPGGVKMGNPSEEKMNKVFVIEKG